MNKFQNLFILYLSFFILISCSFDNRTGIWKDKSKELKMQTLGENIKPVFSKVEKLKKETTINGKPTCILLIGFCLFTLI